MRFCLPGMKVFILFLTLCLTAEAAELYSAPPDITQGEGWVSNVGVQQVVQEFSLAKGGRANMVTFYGTASELDVYPRGGFTLELFSDIGGAPSPVSFHSIKDHFAYGIDTGLNTLSGTDIFEYTLPLPDMYFAPGKTHWLGLKSPSDELWYWMHASSDGSGNAFSRSGDDAVWSEVVVSNGDKQAFVILGEDIENYVIEDFEDGDYSDWGYFGGNNAGGGFGPLSDRPFQGSFYLSTGWGGEGTASGFYGGLFKNMDNAEQVALPVDPWFSIWVFNQSDATVDQFTLEITLREDLDGNGWTDGGEDSFGLNRTFFSGQFNDKWTQISAPLSSFTSLGTGGDGTFNGNLDEVVLVISGVQGASGSTVEIDYDQLMLTQGPPNTIIEDFEDGDLSDWGYFGGTDAGGGFGLETDRAYEGTYYLSTGWGGEGTASNFYGGIFKNLENSAQVPVPDEASFSVWVLVQSDSTVDQFTLEIVLREDLDGNGWTNGEEDSFQASRTLSDDSQFDDRWTQIEVPLSSFTSLDTGGDGIFNGDLDEVVFVITDVQGGPESTVEIDFDQLEFTTTSPLPLPTVQFRKAQFDVQEGGTASVDAVLNFSSPNPVSVSFETSDGSATAGSDYVAVSDTLTFPADTLVQTITVQTNNDYLPLGDRKIKLALSDPLGADLGVLDKAIIQIEEDEIACALSSVTVDDFENGELPYGTDANGLDLGYFTLNGSGSSVEISTSPLSGDIALKMDTNAPGNYGGVTRHFANDSSDTWITQDWSANTAVSFSVYGTNSGSNLYFHIKDNRTSDTTDSTETFTYDFRDDFTGWRTFEVLFEDFRRLDTGNGGPNDGLSLTKMHGWSFFASTFTGTLYIDDIKVCGMAPVLPMSVGFDEPKYSVDEGQTAALTVILNSTPTEPLAVNYASAESNAQLDRQYTAVSGTLNFGVGETVKTIEIPTFSDSKHTGDRRVVVNLKEDSVALGFQRRAVLTIVDQDPREVRLVDDFEGFHPYINKAGTVTLASRTVQDSSGDATPYQGDYEDILSATFDTTSESASFDRVFSRGQNWSLDNGLSFWYHGSNSGQSITLQIKDNMAATTAAVDPNDWVMVWSDEFNDAAGTPPNSNIWQQELGDGALADIVGWGNSELQYYTNDISNAATDGNGNLVVRLQDVDTDTTDLVCWYGPCQYTSARLNTQQRIDFEYGRIEARVKVPGGPGGLWPAFWMLGDDFDVVGWPQTGEIDVMEYVSRVPTEVFGTLHGPGYSGGASYGNTYNFGEGVSNSYHTFMIEWGPDTIDWYVDDIQYHAARPADVAPNEWVYNHPFFLILNTAIGGNFGGAVEDGMTFPQDTLVDYVRVYQAADTAERFEAAFVDDFSGWQKISMPFKDFSRSTSQPVGAPDDGLTLSEIWGYGFVMPEGETGSFYLDRVYRVPGNIMFRDGFEPAK